MKHRPVLFLPTDDDKLLISLQSTFYMARTYLWNVMPCSLVEMLGGFGENCCHHDYSDYSNYGWHYMDLNKFSTSNNSFFNIFAILKPFLQYPVCNNTITFTACHLSVRLFFCISSTVHSDAEACRFFKTSVHVYQKTWAHLSEDSYLQP
jgi:hypothetical protein